jgi:hypothetical protein
MPVGIVGDDAMLVALNKLTGETRWKTWMPGAATRAESGSACESRPRGDPSTAPGARDAGSTVEITVTTDPDVHPDLQPLLAILAAR